MAKATHWFVEPGLDQMTNKILAGRLPDDAPIDGLSCSNGKHRVWKCAEEDLIWLLANKQDLLLKFNVFRAICEGDEWRHDPRLVRPIEAHLTIVVS